MFEHAQYKRVAESFCKYMLTHYNPSADDILPFLVNGSVCSELVDVLEGLIG